jgi:replicative DNA helicase
MNNEQFIISNLLFYKENYAHLPMIKSIWFKETLHRKIVEVMQSLYLQNRPFGLFEIVNSVGKEYAIDITQIMNSVYGDGKIDNQLINLQIDFNHRNLVEKLGNLNLNRDLNAITSDLQHLIDESMVQHTKESLPISKVTANVYDEIVKSIERGDRLSGKQTGWNTLDRVIGGWNKSDMVIVAGRPGSGKTAIALSFVRNAALQGHKCLFLSLEMSNEQIAKRYLSLLFPVENHKVRSGYLSNYELENLAIAIVKDDCQFYIDDEAIVDVQIIKSKVKMHKAKYGLDILVIDYLQLIKGNKQNREQEISDISRNLKIIAKELGITVIALAQLSRKCEERADKRPMLSDIRESGSIEQDADIILFPFRQNYYDRQPLEVEDAELIVAKNRHGEVGMIPVTFTPSRTLYQEISN